MGVKFTNRCHPPQRLDHLVPSIFLTPEENEKAAAKLSFLSEKLYDLLPDQSLSPDERLERLARVASHTRPQLENLESAADKLKRLQLRLNELVPGDELTLEQKINHLVSILNEQVPYDGMSVISKLEYLGDPRLPADAPIDLSPNRALLEKTLELQNA